MVFQIYGLLSGGMFQNSFRKRLRAPEKPDGS